MEGPMPPKEPPLVEIKTTQAKKQIAQVMKLLKNYGLESTIGQLERETGLSKDEIKDFQSSTDVIQVLNQYKSNADKDSYKEAYQGIILLNCLRGAYNGPCSEKLPHLLARISV